MVRSGHKGATIWRSLAGPSSVLHLLMPHRLLSAPLTRRIPTPPLQVLHFVTPILASHPPPNTDLKMEGKGGYQVNDARIFFKGQSGGKERGREYTQDKKHLSLLRVKLQALINAVKKKHRFLLCSCDCKARVLNHRDAQP